MGYPVVFVWDSAIVRRQFYEGTGNPSRREIHPWSVIGTSPIPMPLVRPVPVAMVEKNIYINVRNDIDICPGDHDHWRRGRNHKGWGRWDSDPHVDIHLSQRFIETGRAYQQQNPSQQGDEHPFLHKGTSSLRIQR
jgi:hypothetical protein